MAARDAKREVDFLKSLEKKEIIGEAKICKRTKSMACGVCGLVKTSTEADKGFWISSNKIYGAYNGYIPICKSCLEGLYTDYVDKYTKLKYLEPDKEATKRLCMMYNLYYSDKVFNSVMKSNGNKVCFITAYLKRITKYQYLKKDYDSTIDESRKDKNTDNDTNINNADIDLDENLEDSVDKKTLELFGYGLGSKKDYEFLQSQFDDWTSRHECRTKAQEELFKNLCFKQLDILKARREGKDTKDLDRSFQDYLGTLNLQPKQNVVETMADTQTFGTLIDKYENTRPLPEIDEELKDVDNIGLYIDTFFRGHLAKMMGIKNAFSNLYTKFMKKYTATKPEYGGDESSEALFDAIFGNSINDK